MAGYHGPSIVVVKGAGQSAVNGVYVRDGEFEGASKFSRHGEFDGELCIFSVFKCKVSDNTKHWYISSVPTGDIPGTREDTDFYCAPVTDTCLEFPPLVGWFRSNWGLRPPPTLLFHGPSDIVLQGAGQSAVDDVHVRDGEFEGTSKFSRPGEFDDEHCIFSGPSKLVVKGAGQSAVNGVYARDGEFEGASKFSRHGEFDGQLCIFSVFKGKAGDNAKHWYISIVPTGNIPGTRDDTDFYCVPVTDTCLEFPPLGSWTQSYCGIHPPPTLLFHFPSKLVVKGAGQSAVNGVYVRDGEFEGVSKFSRQGEFDGKQCIFSVFMSNGSSNTPYWYMSIVPTGGIPGTLDDIEFYFTPATDTCLEFPPLGGWTQSYYGIHPTPTLLFQDD